MIIAKNELKNKKFALLSGKFVFCGHVIYFKAMRVLTYPWLKARPVLSTRGGADRKFPMLSSAFLSAVEFTLGIYREFTRKFSLIFSVDKFLCGLYN